MRDTITLLITSILFLSFFYVFIPVEISSAAGNTLHVGSGQNYTTIQDAIDAANESGGDTVYVHSGSYPSPITIDKQLTLTGEGSGTTTISGSDDHTIEVTANGVDISGFKIENSGGSFSGIFLNSVNNCEVSNNIITNAGNGIYTVNSNSNTINNNNFEDSNIGIYLLNSDSNTVFSNSFQNHNAYGIFSDSNSDSNTIYMNDLNDKEDEVGFNARDDGSNDWDYNSQGNYWDDYNDYDTNEDGIGDNPYTIEGSSGSQDDFPLGDFLNINQNPVAFIDSINPNPAVLGQTVTFNGHGTDDGTIIAWEWKANDVIISNSEDFQKSDLSVGTYTIYFRVQDNDGEWSGTVTRSLVINSQANQKPTAYILQPKSDQTYTYGTDISFLGQGSDPDGGILIDYSWRSNTDGVLSNSRQFIKNDLSIETHSIYFKVKDDEGEWSSEVSIAVTIQVNPSSNNPPVADAGGPYSGNTNITLTFDGSNSYDPDSGDSISSYSWDFGDGSSGEGESPKHTYTSIGDYTVELTVTDSNGAQSKITTNANISMHTNGENGSNGSTDKTPGFEAFYVIISITLILFFSRKKNKKKN